MSEWSSTPICFNAHVHILLRARHFITNREARLRAWSACHLGDVADSATGVFRVGKCEDAAAAQGIPARVTVLSLLEFTSYAKKVPLEHV